MQHRHRSICVDPGSPGNIASRITEKRSFWMVYFPGYVCFWLIPCLPCEFRSCTTVYYTTFYTFCNTRWRKILLNAPKNYRPPSCKSTKSWEKDFHFTPPRAFFMNLFPLGLPSFPPLQSGRKGRRHIESRNRGISTAGILIRPVQRRNRFYYTGILMS